MTITRAFGRDAAHKEKETRKKIAIIIIVVKELVRAAKMSSSYDAHYDIIYCNNKQIYYIIIIHEYNTEACRARVFDRGGEAAAARARCNKNDRRARWLTRPRRANPRARGAYSAIINTSGNSCVFFARGRRSRRVFSLFWNSRGKMVPPRRRVLAKRFFSVCFFFFSNRLAIN